MSGMEKAATHRPLSYTLAAKAAHALLASAVWTFQPICLILGDSSLSLDFSVRLISLEHQKILFQDLAGCMLCFVRTR